MLCSRPHRGSLQHSPRSPSCIRRGGEGEEMGGKGRRRKGRIGGRGEGRGGRRGRNASHFLGQVYAPDVMKDKTKYQVRDSQDPGQSLSKMCSAKLSSQNCQDRCQGRGLSKERKVKAEVVKAKPRPLRTSKACVENACSKRFQTTHKTTACSTVVKFYYRFQQIFRCHHCY